MTESTIIEDPALIEELRAIPRPDPGRALSDDTRALLEGRVILVPTGRPLNGRWNATMRKRGLRLRTQKRPEGTYVWTESRDTEQEEAK